MKIINLLNIIKEFIPEIYSKQSSLGEEIRVTKRKNFQTLGIPDKTLLAEVFSFTKELLRELESKYSEINCITTLYEKLANKKADEKVTTEEFFELATIYKKFLALHSPALAKRLEKTCFENIFSAINCISLTFENFNIIWKHKNSARNVRNVAYGLLYMDHCSDPSNNSLWRKLINEYHFLACLISDLFMEIRNENFNETDLHVAIGEWALRRWNINTAEHLHTIQQYPKEAGFIGILFGLLLQNNLLNEKTIKTICKNHQYAKYIVNAITIQSSASLYDTSLSENLFEAVCKEPQIAPIIVCDFIENPSMIEDSVEASYLAEIRKNARLLSQGARCNVSTFFKIPPEISALIAKFTASKHLREESAEYMALKYS